PQPALSPPAPHLSQLAEDPTWKAILNRLDAEHRGLARVFEAAVPLELTPERVRLAFDENNVLSEQAKETDAHQAITRAVRAHFGKPTEVALELSKKAPAGASVASLGAKADRERNAKAHDEVAKHPLVLEAISLFSGELRDVKLPDPRD
ncbi:MAG: DNA polymerase III subunit gamma/tau, partial [Polyangiaceae bacterium]